MEGGYFYKTLTTMNVNTPTFVENFHSFYNDLCEYISEHEFHQKEVPDKYRSLKDELDEIAIMIDENEDDAYKAYYELDCSRYPTFRTYKNNTDVKHINDIEFSMETSKVMRSKRSITQCPMCGIPLRFSNSVLGCPNCNFEAPKTYSAPNTKLNINNTKHIIKQLDAISGQKKIPVSINKIIRYIELWLTDLRYISDWLDYMKLKEKFTAEVSSFLHTVIDSNWYNRTLEKTPKNKWSFKIYKLIMDEFYRMSEYAKRLTNSGISYMHSLDDELVLRVLDEYLKTAITSSRDERSTLIPGINDTVVLDDHCYDIGLYFANISYRPSFKNTALYKTIVERFRSVDIAFNEKSLMIGGLMFDFDSVYKANENIPKKYNYGQEYYTISNHVFNVPYQEISNKDKDLLLELFVDFNNYYKKNVVKFNNHNTKNNSPLFGCVLICIVKSLNYFHKYIPLLYSLPEKYIESSTMDSIASYWWLYLYNNTGIYIKYRHIDTHENKGTDEDFDVI